MAKFRKTVDRATSIVKDPKYTKVERQVAGIMGLFDLKADEAIERLDAMKKKIEAWQKKNEGKGP